MSVPGIESPEKLVTLVDDDPVLATAVSVALNSVKLDTQIFHSAEDFLEQINEPPSGCMVVDLSLKEMSGLELLNVIRKRGWNTPAIVLSGTVNVPEAVDALEIGALDVLQKPVNVHQLQQAVQKALLVADKDVPNPGVLRQRVEALSDKERNVLAYMLEGRMNKSIALRMDIGLRSVVRHKKNVLGKLGFKEPADLIRDWTRAEMDSPTIVAGGMISVLPQRVREELRLNINDIAARMRSCLQDSNASADGGLMSILQDLNGLSHSNSLLSPGELAGSFRHTPVAVILSDSKQESMLLGRVFRLNQFFPDVCEDADALIESLKSLDSNFPSFVILNGDTCTRENLPRILDAMRAGQSAPTGLITMSESPELPLSIGDVKHLHYRRPFDPADVLGDVLGDVIAMMS